MKLHSLGEQLRAARIKKELSLYDVEKISGVEAQFLLAMEIFRPQSWHTFFSGGIRVLHPGHG